MRKLDCGVILGPAVLRVKDLLLCPTQPCVARRTTSPPLGRGLLLVHVEQNLFVVSLLVWKEKHDLKLISLS